MKTFFHCVLISFIFLSGVLAAAVSTPAGCILFLALGWIERDLSASGEDDDDNDIIT